MGGEVVARSLIGHALRDKIRARGTLLFAADAALAIGQTAGWAVGLAATAALTLVVVAPVIVVDEAVRSLRGHARRCDGGCGSRSMDDCRHGEGRPS